MGLKRYSLQEWRRINQPIEDELPSGLLVRVKKVDVADLVLNGGIPTPLLSHLDELDDRGMKFKLSEAPKYMQLIDAVVKGIVVYPPIADEPDEQHMGIRELSFSDKVHLFNWASQGADALASFRAQQGSNVDAGRHVSAIQPHAESNNGIGHAELGSVPV